MTTIKYPPEEIYAPPPLEKKNFEHIILWMLANNEECEWADFIQKPLEIRLSTLSKYLSLLKSRNCVVNISRGHYKITSEGRKRYLELSRAKKKGRTLSYPPNVIKRRRNYDHWILWMVYNNGFCKWADFLAEPLSINQSSLSKNMNLLLEKSFIEKDEKKYLITRSGKLEYSRMLQEYDLDKQSILDEESKRIEEITNKTIIFFDKYKIDDEDIQFRFLNNILKLDYTRVESMLTDEEDFDKILLFISINHPNQYPDSISKKEFSKRYGIKESKLEYYVDEIVENNIFPIKFFKIVESPGVTFYFQENEKLEIMLRAITEDHITKITYLDKLFSRPINKKTIIDNIQKDASRLLFHKDLKDPLRDFLSGYINYLAYKIEAKVEFRETYDKLEGIIWQQMTDIFQSKSYEDLAENYEEEITKIDKEIESDPENFELYDLKVRVMINYDRFDSALEHLDEMLKIFPDSEKDIKMKEASVLRRMQEVQAGLDIINELLKKYPEDNDLLNYKAYWLQYLDKREEALNIIQELVDQFPDNGMYHDTHGEILMYFEDYENAIKEFSKVDEIASDDWFIYQTYIKLGICYKELKKYESAIEYLEKGKEYTDICSCDLETKQKWITIADLFLSEIEHYL
ncbi:MAG: tetratricopeptide repeat protein [Candidatus Thorarchaeota archaeon]